MGVELGDLAARGGGGLHEANLELSTRGVDTGSGLLLGIRDVLHGLSETTVLEGLLGAQGGVHAGGGSLKHHVGVVAILGHASTDLAELGSSGGSDGTDLVVREVAERLVLGGSLGSELGAALLGLLVHVRHLLVEAAHGLLEVLAGLLGVLTDLGSVGSDVLVGLLDLRVGGGSKSRKSALLVEHRDLKAASSSTLVLAHDLTSLAGTADGGAVALVGELSLGSELSLHTTHVAVERLLGTPGVDGHLGEQLLLHRGTGGLVVCEVARHVGTDRRNVGTTAGRLLRDLLLDLVEVLEKAHTPIRGVCHDHASLLDIHRLDGSWTTDVVSRSNVTIVLNQNRLGFGVTVCCDVHHRAADCQSRQERKGDTCTRTLRVHSLMQVHVQRTFPWLSEKPCPPC